MSRACLTTDEMVIAIVDAVRSIEPHLTAEAILDAVEATVMSQPELKRLARTLRRDASVLTGPAGAHCIANTESLIRNIRRIGGTAVSVRTCGLCGINETDVYSRQLKKRICRPCASSRWQPDEGECVNCGRVRRQVYRAREGGWLCFNCKPEPDVDHAAEVRKGISAIVNGLEPTEIDTIASVFGTTRALRELNWILHDQPDVFTGETPHSSALSVRLAESLIAAGATGIQRPQCPFCFREAHLSSSLDGQRCCHTCWERRRSRGTCIRCGKDRHLTNFDGAGVRLCGPCFERDPINHRECTRCGRLDFVNHRDGEDIWCRRCYRAPTAACSSCGKVRQCDRIKTGKPICGTCAGKQRTKEECSICHRIRLVQKRTETGEPICSICGQRREPCVRCHKTLHVAARLDDVGPLCSGCLKLEPAYFSNCVQCGKYGRTYHRGLCNDCACPGVLQQLFSRDDGQLGLAAAKVVDALGKCDSRAVLRWAQRTRQEGQLAIGIRDFGDVLDHEALDGLPPSKSVEWLRNVLVEAGALPARDVYLRRTELFVTTRLQTVANREDRVVARAFMEWHHLRKLRDHAAKKPLRKGHGSAAQTEIVAISAFLIDLHVQGASLATCRQDHVDDWLVRNPTRTQIHQFLAWAVGRGHARNVRAPQPADRRTRKTLVGDDERWRLIQYLIEDPDLETRDRVAGLLVLLYSQQTSRLVGVRVADVAITENRDVTLKLGTVPLNVPAPVDRLLAELIEQRRGYAAVVPGDNPWLFPGGRAGRHISEGQMGARLRRIGISPLLARNTALIELAGELPAAIISKLLGFSIKRAASWNIEAGNTNPRYAAAVARRGRQ